MSDQELFFTERVAQEFVKYELPIPGDGVFTLITKHAEAATQKANTRIFNIFLAGELVHSNVDIFKEMGFKSGFNTYTEFEVRGSDVKIKGKEIKNVIFKGNKHVKFRFAILRCNRELIG